MTWTAGDVRRATERFAAGLADADLGPRRLHDPDTAPVDRLAGFLASRLSP